MKVIQVIAGLGMALLSVASGLPAVDSNDVDLKNICGGGADAGCYIKRAVIRDCRSPTDSGCYIKRGLGVRDCRSPTDSGCYIKRAVEAEDSNNIDPMNICGGGADAGCYIKRNF